MTFKLLKKQTGRSLTTFHVLDESDAIVGSVNVLNEQADDFLKHWVPSRPASAGALRSNALAEAFKRAEASSVAGRRPE